MAFNPTPDEVEKVAAGLLPDWLPAARKTGGEWRGPCPLHGGKPDSDSFALNVASGKWTCHSKCGGGDLVRLAEKALPGDLAQALAEVERLAGRQPEARPKGRARGRSPAPPPAPKAPPKPLPTWAPRWLAPEAMPDLRAVDTQGPEVQGNPTMARVAAGMLRAAKASSGLLTVYAEGYGHPQAFAVVRLDHKDAQGGAAKQVRAIAWEGHDWTMQASEALGKAAWPIFAPGHAGKLPEGAVVVAVEGEKAALAAAKTLPPGFVAVSWPGGAKRARLGDLAPLAGRKVYLAPDHDEPGQGWAHGLTSMLSGLRCTVHLVGYEPAPGGIPLAELPEGWDVADASEADLVGWWGEALTSAPEVKPAPAELVDGDAKAAIAPGQAEAVVVERGDGKAYELSAHGVTLCTWRSNKDGGGEWLPKKAIAPRPAWVVGVGEDLASPEAPTWYELAWQDAIGRRRGGWFPAKTLTDKAELGRLGDQGLPVDAEGRAELSAWLNHHATEVGRGKEPQALTSRLGWVGGRYVPPSGLPGVVAVGEAAKALAAPAGTLEGYLEGLRELAQLGEAGFPGLALVAMAVGAPLVRFLGKRNPLLGYAADSGHGKTTIARFALAAFGPPEDPRAHFALGATQAGLEAALRTAGDRLIFLDEMHLRASDPAKLSSLLYFLGNGGATAKARRDGTTRDTSPWRGVAAYASERALMGGLEAGVMARIIELASSPLPYNGRTAPGRPHTHEVLREADKNHGHLLALVASKAFPTEADAKELAAAVLECAAKLKAQVGAALTGEQHVTAALVAVAVDAIEAAVEDHLGRGLGLPAGDEVAAWLLDQGIIEAMGQQDRDAEIFLELVNRIKAWGLLCTPPSGLGEPRDGLAELRIPVNGDVLAWAPVFGQGGTIDVNPSHPEMARIFASCGGRRSLLKSWARRGWLRRGATDELTAKRRVQDAGLVSVLRLVVPDAGSKGDA